MTRSISARLLAVQVLTRIERDRAFANILLRNELPALVDVRERQLCTALVNGVLKNRSLLDYVLRRHLRKPVGDLPVVLRQILRGGAFQLLFMDRLPVSAVVDESVKLVRVVFQSEADVNPQPEKSLDRGTGTRNDGERYTGLTNAVLRRVAEMQWDFAWPDMKKDPVYALSARYSHPQWLVQLWRERWGDGQTAALCAANNEEAMLCVRANTLLNSRTELMTRLEEEGCRGVTLSRWATDGLCLDKLAMSLEDLPSFQQGRFVVQDESSQLAARLLGARAGERVLDVCSAPGGKAGYLAQAMNNDGEIVAVDVAADKLAQVDQMCQRLGVRIVKTKLGNGCVLFGIPGLFDRVLVDAPCSGLGVLRRRADLRWQKRAEDLAALPPLQLAILDRAGDFVKPGGVLLYATCTIEPRENFEVVKAFRANRPEFVPDDLSDDLAFCLPLASQKDQVQWKKGMWQILPHAHGMDGFFISRMRRKAD